MVEDEKIYVSNEDSAERERNLHPKKDIWVYSLEDNFWI